MDGGLGVDVGMIESVSVHDAAGFDDGIAGECEVAKAVGGFRVATGVSVDGHPTAIGGGGCEEFFKVFCFGSVAACEDL